MKLVLFLATIASSIVGFSMWHGRYIGTTDARATVIQQERADKPATVPDAKAGAIAQGTGSDGGGVRRMAPGFNDASGISGKAGPQGYVGLVGAQGPAGSLTSWTPYQRFAFDPDSAEIRFSDMRQASDITAYMLENPTVRIGIDGSSNAQTSEWRGQALAERRIGAVRDALIQAGTPAFKIQIGAFGDPDFRRENQVEVLLISVR